MRVIDRGLDDGSGCARRKCPVEKAVTVGGLALQGNEQVAGADLAAVEGDTGDGKVGAGDAAGCLGDLARSP